MSQPFSLLVGKRAEQFEDVELTERAFTAFNRWSLLSSDKLVSLDEVAWIGALLVKAFKHSGVDIQRHEATGPDGERVVQVTASDGVPVADGAG